jgi:hypothetical protein
MRKTNKSVAFAAQLPGYHNQNFASSVERIHRGHSYRNLSTIWVTVTRGVFKSKVVSNWMALMKPMNQPFVGPLFFENEEVGIAYQKAFELILDHPDLSKFKYVLTVEEDNLPPQDGLLKLYENIDDYDCVAGLYWTKGENGQPMIYGNPDEKPMNFVPQAPLADSVQRCNGLGMGFNLWKLASFKGKLKEMPKPWFRTVQEIGKGFTQDLFFFNEAAKFGFRCACDTRVKVGHLAEDGMVW